jgi:fructose-1,6-bisphosphatase
MRGRGVLFVMPVKADIQFTRYRIFWIPAFAGMTVCIAENFPTAQINRICILEISVNPK